MGRRCLVVGPAWVGDMVMAQSLFRQLKLDSPNLYLAVLAPAWTKALLSRMPEVDQSIEMPLGHGQVQLTTRWRLARQIKALGFDQAIVLPSSLKAALIPFFAKIPQRTGFIGELRYGLINDIRKLDKKALSLNVQRFLALGRPPFKTPKSIPKPLLQIDKTAQKAICQQFGITNKPCLVLCPGAKYGPAKQWPATHFSKVANHQLTKGWQVILVGAKEDEKICGQINQQSKNKCVDLSAKTSLPQVIDILSLADHVLANDSGLMHIAAALRRPVTAIYGSSSPNFTPPLSDNSHIVQLNLDCQPCFKRDCPLGHTHCLTELKPDIVINTMTVN